MRSVPHALTRTDVLIAAGVLYAAEFVADKIPYVDSLWDAVHTVIRPATERRSAYCSRATPTVFSRPSWPALGASPPWRATP